MSGSRKKLSNLARLGAILVVLRDDGPEASLRSILDANLLRANIVDAVRTGEAFVSELASTDKSDEDLAGELLEKFQNHVYPKLGE